MTRRREQSLALLRHLVRMQMAGLSCLESLNMWRDTSASQTTRQQAGALIRHLRLGQSLSDALARNGFLSGSALALSRAAENNGVWAQQMSVWLSQQDQHERWRRQLSSSLAYPAVVLALATTVMTAIMVWVIPTFETLYLNMQATLPWPTRWLLLTRQLVMNGGVWMGVAVPLLSVAMAWGLRQPPWALRLDALIWRLPRIGPWRRMQVESRWCGLLAQLVEAGLDWATALSLSGAAVGSPVMHKAMPMLRHSLSSGLTLGQAMAHCAAPGRQRSRRLFSPMLTQWVRAGETTGTVCQVLQQWAAIQHDALVTQSNAALRMLEPALMGVLGFLMGWLVLALYLPVLQMGQIL
jgi:type II secretory pathway component PulF